MLRTRVIPCLLLRDMGLVKTVKFKDARYIGDAINAVRIFNDKEVDELVFLDINATINGRGPNFDVIAKIAEEAFMPFAYGGGISTVADASKLIGLGVEKVVLNTAVEEKPDLVSEIVKIAGSQAVVASMDVKRNWRGKYAVMTRSGTGNTAIDPVTYVRQAEQLGVGEILLTSIDRDGTHKGYDLDLVQQVAGAVSIPVVANGGAANIDDLVAAVEHGASAVAAGSLFVFYGKHRAVLITYPDYRELQQRLSIARSVDATGPNKQH